MSLTGLVVRKTNKVVATEFVGIALPASYMHGHWMDNQGSYHQVRFVFYFKLKKYMQLQKMYFNIVVAIMSVLSALE